LVSERIGLQKDCLRPARHVVMNRSRQSALAIIPERQVTWKTQVRLLIRARNALADNLNEAGGCDHSVGVCMCSDRYLIQSIDHHLLNKIDGFKDGYLDGYGIRAKVQP
jgi:hypothetical protein